MKIPLCSTANVYDPDTLFVCCSTAAVLSWFDPTTWLPYHLVAIPWDSFFQTVGVARPSDFDEHVAAASMYDRADELVVPVQDALR